MGSPPLFVTFTCNPDWAEILGELLPEQKPADRPDLCARVFKMKLDELMNDIKKKQVFGKVSGIVYSIEFQKRGLPHAHILIILDADDAPLTTDDYDKFVCAELPDPEQDPELFGIITKRNLHGPCSDRCQDENGVCKKDYLKIFKAQTERNSNERKLSETEGS